MSEAPPEPEQEPQHHHYYRFDISDWWCGDCETVTDFCVNINDFGQGDKDA